MQDSAVAPTASVLICTYNRATLLGDTLDSLGRMRVSPRLVWDVLVVDNNSTDATRHVVTSRIAGFPVPLRYFHEPRQGKSYALNTGLEATRAEFIVFTDDDVRVSEGWLEAAVQPMIEDLTIQYTGGPVRPIWGARRPSWLSDRRGDLWGAIATLDYGPEPFVFEERHRIPLGANMAVRRSLVDAVGGFHPQLGRTGGSLLGQEQAEFFCRTRDAGAYGLYVPAMELQHHVPAARLTRKYFRKWWVWKGISRARLHRMHPRMELNLDLRQVPRVSGVPRHIFGDILRHGRGLVRSTLQRDPVQRARHEMMLAYCAGYAFDSWRHRHTPSDMAPGHPAHQGTQGTQGTPGT